MHIPFNKPYFTGRELGYIEEAHRLGHLSGDGAFTRKCHGWLEEKTGCRKALLTHSCTAALEMAALLLDLKPGNEVIMPSYTFVSTANAFVLRGAVPVFVDIRPDTLNLDESKVEAAITPKTKAIVAVHYAGVPCEMDALSQIARRHKLWLVEDAAQGIGSSYKGKALGNLGTFGTLSFHETKNIISGEGGALLVNEDAFTERAQILREKGTNRIQFNQGRVDKYTWVDLGSSYLPSELVAAFLWAQLEDFDSIMKRRMGLWESYHRAFESAEKKGRLRRPVIPADCGHNAHMYYLLLPTAEKRPAFLAGLNQKDVNAIFHYVPLHSSPAGQKYGKAAGPLPVTEQMSARIVRLPLWIGMEKEQPVVIEKVLSELEKA